MFQEDRNGKLWLGFDGKGLACYDSKQINYKLFNTHNSNIPSNLIIGSYLDSKGKMWFGSYGGGIFYEQNGIFFPFKQTLEPIEYVRHIADDKYGNLWVGTFMHGLYCIDNGGKITSYTKRIHVYTPIPLQIWSIQVTMRCYILVLVRDYMS